MKKLSVVLALIILLNSLLFSQEDKKEDKKSFIPEIKEGTIGLLFSFDGQYLRTGTYDGGIGMKYFLKDNIALRGMFQFSYINLHQDKKENSPAWYDSKKTSVGLSAALEYWLKKGRISPVLGGGTYLGYSNSKIEDNVMTQKNQDDGLNIGLFLFAGVELFLIENLSFSAEYRFTCYYHSPFDVKYKHENHEEIITKRYSSLNIGTGNVGLLTISFYL